MTGPIVRIAGLPDFNAGDPEYRCTALTGWYGRPTPRAELVPSARAGAVAIGPWDDSEQYLIFAGVLRADDRATLLARRRTLLNALPANEDTWLTVLDDDVDLQMLVRRYDETDPEIVGRNCLFSIPLVATDPGRYGAVTLSGSFGAFTGDAWFVEPTVDAGTWAIEPTVDAGTWAVEFQQEEVDPNELPKYLTLMSNGDETSRRVTIEVTGPLTAGDWYVVNEATGHQLWADLDLLAGQTIIFDCYSQAVTLNGTSIDNLVYGDFLTLEPGGNTYRLVAGTASDGFARIADALPRYR